MREGPGLVSVVLSGMEAKARHAQTAPALHALHCNVEPHSCNQDLSVGLYLPPKLARGESTRRPPAELHAIHSTITKASRTPWCLLGCLFA